MVVSSYLTQMWTNFAVNGDPGLGAVPWNSTHQKYTKVFINIITNKKPSCQLFVQITNELQIASDYRLEYHIAADQAYNRTEDNQDSGSQTAASSLVLVTFVIYNWLLN